MPEIILYLMDPIKMATRHIMVICGLPNAGKSTFIRLLHKEISIQLSIPTPQNSKGPLRPIIDHSSRRIYLFILQSIHENPIRLNYYLSRIKGVLSKYPSYELIAVGAAWPDQAGRPPNFSTYFQQLISTFIPTHTTFCRLIPDYMNRTMRPLSPNELAILATHGTFQIDVPVQPTTNLTTHVINLAKRLAI